MYIYGEEREWKGNVLIIKEERKNRGATRLSLRFFKERREEFGRIKYIVLINTDWDRVQVTVLIGENKQMWLYGLNWGYNGEGPHGLHEIMSWIDPTVTFEQVMSLEQCPEVPIVFENVEGILVVRPVGCLFTNRFKFQEIWKGFLDYVDHVNNI